jgi:hypothetical protein
MRLKYPLFSLIFCTAAGVSIAAHIPENEPVASFFVSPASPQLTSRGNRIEIARVAVARWVYPERVVGR